MEVFTGSDGVLPDYPVSQPFASPRFDEPLNLAPIVPPGRLRPVLPWLVRAGFYPDLFPLLVLTCAHSTTTLVVFWREGILQGCAVMFSA